MGMEITIDGSHVRNVSAAAAETGAIARNGLDPSQPVMWNKAGDYFYQYDSPTSLNPPKEFNDEQLAKRVKEDEQKREKEKQIQSPTSANPAPPELIPDESKAIAVCLSPDVCKSPEKPVPYMSWGEASDDQNYSPDVRSNGKIIKRQDSKFSCCYGDEPGVGLGCKSNTVGGVVEPVTSSQIVRANGIWVQRHGDRCTLNKGNTEGEYVHVEATDSHKAPEGTDKQDQSGGKAEDTRSEGQKFSDGFTENASETWEGLKKVGSDVLEGTKNLASDLWNDPTGTVAAGAESVKDGAVGAANWTAEVAQNLYDDPGATLGRGWENTQNTASSIWHAVADPYSEAYEKGGLSQAVGHGTFDVVKLAVEALATKGRPRWPERPHRSVPGLRPRRTKPKRLRKPSTMREDRIEGRGWRAWCEKHAETEGTVFRSAARGQSRRVPTPAERTAGDDQKHDGGRHGLRSYGSRSRS